MAPSFCSWRDADEGARTVSGRSRRAGEPALYRVSDFPDVLARRASRLDSRKDELEFRGMVGELADGVLAKNVRAAQAALDQCTADQRAIDAGSSRAARSPNSRARSRTRALQ
jgi:hypothetical protein